MITRILGFAFDCKNANELADFYLKLTGWQKEIASDEWAALRIPQGSLLVFQTVANYQAPVWPWQDDKQQQMAHIDFLVEDLEAAVEHAINCGAIKARVQYYETSTVLFDPSGHPFCLSTADQ